MGLMGFAILGLMVFEILGLLVLFWMWQRGGIPPSFQMLSRAIPFREALRNLSEVYPSYKCFPSDLEWSRGALICDFLSIC